MKEYFEQHRWAIELIGIVSIIASLLFVGMQLTLDRRIAAGAQFHERMLIAHDASLAYFQNEEWIKMQAGLWENGFTPRWWNSEIETFADQRELSMEDLARMELVARMSAYRFNNNYFQYQQGLIEEDSWQNILNGYRANFRDPIRQAVFLNINNLETEAVEIVRRLIDEVNDFN